MKTPEKEMTGQIIGVDAGKLSQGLRTAFEGVAMIFDSLGADFTPDDSNVFKKYDAEESEMERAEQTQSVEEFAEKGDAQAAADPEEKAVPVDTAETTDTAEKKETAPSITLDDVTKIIVQKIKQNRSNNEKIGQILKSYGTAKVGELPQDKYEVFLTDLAAL